MGDLEMDNMSIKRIQLLQWFVRKVSWHKSKISLVQKGNGVHSENPSRTSASVSLVFLSGRWHMKMVNKAIVPTCVFCVLAADATYCGMPPKIENTVVMSSGKLFPPDSVVTYQCRHEFTTEGDGRSVCVNGQWDVKNFACTGMYIHFLQLLSSVKIRVWVFFFVLCFCFLMQSLNDFGLHSGCL